MTEQEKMEKVSKGLEQFISDFKPFYGNKADWKRVYDALALLKAQEPVEPTWRHGYAFCGKCGRHFGRGYKYCPDCGQAVKWDG